MACRSRDGRFAFWFGVAAHRRSARSSVRCRSGYGSGAAIRARRADSIDGVVVSKDHQARHARRVERHGTEYTVAYRFTVGGQTYNGEDVGLVEEWEQLRELEPVPIQYVAVESARENRIAGRTTGARCGRVLSVSDGVRGRTALTEGSVHGEIDRFCKDESAYLDTRHCQ